MRNQHNVSELQLPTTPSPPDWCRVALALLRWAHNRPSHPRADTLNLHKHGLSVLEDLRRHQLDGLFFLCCSPECATQQLYDRVWSLQRKLLCEIITAFSDDGIAPIIFKGAEVVERYYRSRPLSIMDDVDIIVKPSQLISTMKILFSLGFRPARYDPDTKQMRDVAIDAFGEVLKKHYELPSFVKTVPLDLNDDELEHATNWGNWPFGAIRGKSQLHVAVDIHYRVAFDLDMEECAQRVVPSAFPQAFSLSPADMLWIMTARYYTEVTFHRKRSLRDMAYLSATLTDPELDWSLVVEAANRYNLHPGLFYYLSFLDAVVGGEGVPKSVLDALNPTRGTRDKDWGWQLGTLFDAIEPLPWPTLCCTESGLE